MELLVCWRLSDENEGTSSRLAHIELGHYDKVVLTEMPQVVKSIVHLTCLSISDSG